MAAAAANHELVFIDQRVVRSLRCEREARDAADKPLLDRLCKQFYDPTDAILVVVGPGARVKAMIDKLGLPPAQMRDAEGNVLK